MINNAFLYGLPESTANIKTSPDDFIVKEDLGFSLDGEGEHIFVLLQKRGCNTAFVADKLAEFAHIAKRNVSYAGLKDKHALTTQWFCLHIPGKETPDFSQFSLDGCDILHVTRHRKKLRIGALAGNFFELTLRNVSEPDDVLQRWQQIVERGAPNYFGSQRFGINGQNLTRALAWANGEIKVNDRQKRSFYLSAARSALFNHVVSERIRQDHFDRILSGDILQLTHRGSWFVAQTDEIDALQTRLQNQEIQLTAPLAGEDDLGTQQNALQFEQDCLAGNDHLFALFAKERVKTARRAIRVLPQNACIEMLDKQTIKLTFWLTSGSFATALLRELIRENDIFGSISE